MIVRSHFVKIQHTGKTIKSKKPVYDLQTFAYLATTSSRTWSLGLVRLQSGEADSWFMDTREVLSQALSVGSRFY